ncbi:F-box protein SKIP24 [Linum perenne]
MAAALPDELWRQILEIGVRNSTLTYKDLCCLAISSSRLRRLSDDDSIWSVVFASDFPSQNPSSSSAKSTYRISFEKERERKIAAHRRALLRKESQVLERRRSLREIEDRLCRESEKLRGAAMELSNLHKVRQASVALNVWQPQAVRGRQKQVVEQCSVPVESQLHSLEMEMKLCKQQISGLKKTHKDEKLRLEAAEKELESMKYHPLQAVNRSAGVAGGSEVNPKRKKLKKSIPCKSLELVFFPVLYGRAEYHEMNPTENPVLPFS